MTTETPADSKSSSRRAIIVIATLLVGLALAPGYLLLCGNASGRQSAHYDLYLAATDGNSVQSISKTVPLTKDMDPVGINIIIETPFRDHAKAEAARLRTSLVKDGKEVWASDFSLGHGRRQEAIAGTTFAMRARSFRISEDGQYTFTLSSEPALENVRSLSLEVRSNVMLPNRWVVGLGLVIILGVIIWAIIPPKGYDPKSERTGTKWYED